MSTLHFRRLQVRRMPGVDDGGFTLDGLGEGINLIHGPNASGKTTSARAMQAILWPRVPGAERAWLAAEYTVDGVAWTASVDGGRGEYQREGVPTEPLALPPETERDRYGLALHELLLSEDREFARRIQQESAGGFDLSAAAEILSPRATASRSPSEVRALDDARRAHRVALEKQQDIRAGESSLAELQSRRDRAAAASVRVALLQAAVEHATARDDEGDARIALEGFPGWMPRLRGDEQQRLADLRERAATLRADLQKANQDAEKASAAIEAAMLPEGGVSGVTIPGLRADLATLHQAERELGTMKDHRASLLTREAEERTRVSAALGEQRLHDLDHPAMRDLADFARHAAEVRAEQRRLELERDSIGDVSQGEDPERLFDGIRLLQRWLREPIPAGPDVRSRNLGLVAAGLLVLAGIVFALLNPLSLLASVIGAILVFLMLGRHVPAEDARRVHRASYEGLQLSAPAAWEPPEVEGVLRELIARHHDAIEMRDRGRRHTAVTRRLRAHEPKLLEVEEERAEIESRLGVAPGMDEGHLHWLAARICRWQDASSDLAAAEAALETASGRAQRLRDDLRSRLAAFFAEALASTGEIASAIEELESRQRALTDAHRDLSSAGAVMERVRHDLGSCDADRHSIFQSLELAEEDEPILAHWSPRLEEYRAAAEMAQTRATLLSRARQRLASHDAEEQLFTSPVQTLQLQLDEARVTAAGLREIDEQMLTIRLGVQEARRSHDIEAALESVERGEQALRDARDRDVASVIAGVLVDHVDRETRDLHLPAVFRGASDLFTRLTHGRYHLQFTTDDGPQFRAYDNREKQRRTLDQLSSGTRVQLLLAVRIAFVEAQEQGLKLPLVFDEVLGNSDDERASAIIEAAITLARAGRQIFYFTAQQDEVGKWRSIVARHPDVGFREVDLREARRMARAADFTASEIPFELAPRAPHPDGDDHAAYGKRLRVPALDRSTTQVGELHLWYLLDSPQDCHRLLEIGPERWGELERFMASGGHRMVDERLARRLPLLARAAELFMQESRVGAGKPVDRAALEDSGAVTSTFLDRVTDLAEAVHGDAAELVSGLKQRRVAGFRVSSAEALEVYLEEHGYLDRRARLEPREIRNRVVATLADEVDGGNISLDAVDGLLLRLQAGLDARRATSLTAL